MSIIQYIGGHEVHLPAPPTDKREILFWDAKNDRDAFWRRDLLIKEYRDIWFEFIPHFTKLDQAITQYDQDEQLISLNKEDSDYIRRTYEQEVERRMYGVHFRNGDQIDYLTEDHYFALMWCKMQRHDGQGDYGDYREFQADYFKLIRHTKRSPNILGLDISKPKKTGITNLHWMYYLNKATLYKNKNLGMMNIDQALAAKTFQDYFLYSYNGLPSPLKPNVKNISERDGNIKFGAAFSKNRKFAKRSDADIELNTSVFCVATKPKAFDVAVMDDVTIDEFPKIIKESPAEIFRTNKQAVKIQSKINGKMWLYAYTPEEDNDSFREAKKIFDDSELTTIKPGSNSTISELINHHIPAYGAWEGCFDKHGRCDEKRAMAEIESERNRIKGDRRGLQALIRQYANTKKEAWGSAGAGSIYDNIRLGELYADVEIEERNSPFPCYREGYLRWTNPTWELGMYDRRPNGSFCPVEWVDLTEDDRDKGKTGKMRMYNDIPPHMANEALKYGRDENKCLHPPERHSFILGGDPTNYAAGSEVIEGSKNAGYLISMPDERADTRAKGVASKIIHIEYFDRPELPEEAYEDFLKLIIYTGALASIEANAGYVATRLMKEGMGNYMLVRDENGVITKWKRYMGLAHESEKTYNLLKTTANADTKEMLETIVRYIKSYIEARKPGEKDYGKTIKSLRLLDQFMNFDATNTKIYDLHMGFGYALVGLYSYIEYLITGPGNEDMERVMEKLLSALQK